MERGTVPLRVWLDEEVSERGQESSRWLADSSKNGGFENSGYLRPVTYKDEGSDEKKNNQMRATV